MKNRKTVKVLLANLYAIMICGFIVFNIINSSSFLLFVLAVIIMGALIRSLQRKSSPIIIYLTGTFNEVLSFILTTTAILLSIYLIPNDYFFISVILIAAAMLTPFLCKKMLIINSIGICYFLKWIIKWEDIVGYDLNKTIGSLNIQMKDGTNKQITNIKSKCYSDIEASLKLI